MLLSPVGMRALREKLTQMRSSRKPRKGLLGHKEIAPPETLKNVDWDDFRIFTSVARAGSYTRAARELGMTQPAVSQRMNKFEHAMGVRLFDRNAQGATLTSDGARVLNYASAAEVALTRAMAMAQDAVENVQGRCSLAVGEGLCAYWVSRFITPFIIANPNIELQVFTTQDRAGSKKALYDLQIQYTEPTDPGLIAMRVANLHFMLYASTDYIATHGAPLQFEDLIDHRLLDHTLGLTQRGTLATWANYSKTPALFTNSMVALAEAARNGSGIALLPTYAGLVDRNLVPLLPGLNFPTPVYLCFERGAREKPAAHVLLEYVRNVVFDKRAMPWFDEEFHIPQQRWHDMFKARLASLGGQKAAKS